MKYASFLKQILYYGKLLYIPFIDAFTCNSIRPMAMRLNHSRISVADNATTPIKRGIQVDVQCRRREFLDSTRQVVKLYNLAINWGLIVGNKFEIQFFFQPVEKTLSVWILCRRKVPTFVKEQECSFVQQVDNGT